MPTTTRRTLTRLGLAVPPWVCCHAADTVKIGAPYPLTGGAASAGTAVKQAIEVAVDIINNPHPELPNLPLAATEGLPGLDGRKVEVLFADRQGNPAIAQSEALRMITEDKVAALTGCYQPSCTLTASAIAERYGIPLMAGDSSAPTLTKRGFKTFFRTTPVGTDFGAAYAAFLTETQNRRLQGRENRHRQRKHRYGTSTANAITDAARAKGLNIDLRIAYNTNSSDVSAQVLQLKNAELENAPPDRRRFRLLRHRLHRGRR
jgi:branched-chain amino acid transport system substrate-binding protein